MTGFEFQIKRKAGKPAKATPVPVAAADKKKARFLKRHAKHGVRQIPVAKGTRTIHKCDGCSRAHVECHG